MDVSGSAIGLYLLHAEQERCVIKLTILFLVGNVKYLFDIEIHFIFDRIRQFRKAAALHQEGGDLS